jgi:hypothetical protein
MPVVDRIALDKAIAQLPPDIEPFLRSMTSKGTNTKR